MFKLVIGFVAVISIFSLLGCDEDQKTPETKPAKPSATAPAEKASDGESRVARVVFIGQENACECTKKRIADTWPVLEKVLAKREDISVKRLQIDVDEEEAERYDEMKSVMVAPGIYFMDKDDKLVEMLQGEVKEDQIIAALGK